MFGVPFRHSFHHPSRNKKSIKEGDGSPALTINQVILESVGQLVVEDLLELVIGTVHRNGDTVFKNFSEPPHAFLENLGGNIGFFELKRSRIDKKGYFG